MLGNLVIILILIDAKDIVFWLFYFINKKWERLCDLIFFLELIVFNIGIFDKKKYSFSI